MNEGGIWAVSEICEYLNGAFYNSFSAADRVRIFETRVANNNTVGIGLDNEPFNVDAGPDTTDKIFLLSIKEAERYFSDNAARVARDANGATREWWLRSPAAEGGTVTTVLNHGLVFIVGWIGGSNFDMERGVRPAMWITLGSAAPTPTPAPRTAYRYTIDGERSGVRLTIEASDAHSVYHERSFPIGRIWSVNLLHDATFRVTEFDPGTSGMRLAVGLNQVYTQESFAALNLRCIFVPSGANVAEVSIRFSAVAPRIVEDMTVLEPTVISSPF